MTLPQNVKDAWKELDAVHDARFAPWRGQWQTIRAQLMSQEAEIELLRVAAEQNLSDAKIAESRLAAAERNASKWLRVEGIVAMAEDEADGQVNTACGLLLIDRAASMSAGKLKMKFSGVTGESDAELGDWIVTVMKSHLQGTDDEP